MRHGITALILSSLHLWIRLIGRKNSLYFRSKSMKIVDFAYVENASSMDNETCRGDPTVFLVLEKHRIFIVQTFLSKNIRPIFLRRCDPEIILADFPLPSTAFPGSIFRTRFSSSVVEYFRLKKVLGAVNVVVWKVRNRWMNTITQFVFTETFIFTILQKIE